MWHTCITNLNTLHASSYIKYHMYFHYKTIIYRVAYTNINHKLHFSIHLCQRWNYSNVCNVYCVCVCVFACVCGNISFQLFWNGKEWNGMNFSNIYHNQIMNIHMDCVEGKPMLCTISFFVWKKRTTTLIILIILTYDLLNNLI